MEEDQYHSRGPEVVSEEAEVEEYRHGCDQIEDGESPLSRFGIPDGDNAVKEKGDSNYGDGKRDGDRDRKSLSTPMDDLSLGADGMCDPLGVMAKCRVELIISISLRRIHMLSGSISDHLSIQGSWGVRLGTSNLFSAQTRSIMNSIGSWIISLGSDKAKE